MSFEGGVLKVDLVTLSYTICLDELKHGTVNISPTTSSRTSICNFIKYGESTSGYRKYPYTLLRLQALLQLQRTSMTHVPFSFSEAPPPTSSRMRASLPPLHADVSEINLSLFGHKHTYAVA